MVYWGYFVLAFVCLLANVILFSVIGDAAGVRGMGDQEMNRIGVHDVKSPIFNKKFRKCEILPSNIKVLLYILLLLSSS